MRGYLYILALTHVRFEFASRNDGSESIYELLQDSGAEVVAEDRSTCELFILKFLYLYDSTVVVEGSGGVIAEYGEDGAAASANVRRESIMSESFPVTLPISNVHLIGRLWKRVLRRF